MPDLDERLDSARADLLIDIKAPELDDIQDRARTIRRRRRGVAAGTALAVVIAMATGVALLGEGRTDQGPPPPASTDGPRPVYRGSGMEVRGLYRAQLDLRNTQPTDVEFADRRHGYALAADCQGGVGPCSLAFATTEDADTGWLERPLPVRDLPRAPDLVAVGDAGVILAAGGKAWFSPDRGITWRPADPAGEPPAVTRLVEGVRLTIRGAGDSCTPRPVEVWQTSGVLGRLAEQPTIDVCWVGSVPAADGSWWVGGIDRSGGAAVPAAAVTHDAGRSWQTMPLHVVAGAPGAWAQVSTIGGEAYATVVGPPPGNAPAYRTVHAIYRLGVGDTQFQPYGSTGLDIIGGDLAPMLDGRLTAASIDMSGEVWMVSDADRTRFAPSGLPGISRIQRSGPYWVAYRLFGGGWPAISEDGVTWDKAHVH
jgi:hypothetical protein